MRRRSRTKRLSNRALLATAWQDVASAPKARVGNSTSVRSAVFSARYNGLCERCGFLIKIGQDIRFHRDFSGVVHSGCRAPEVISRRRFSTSARVVRQPTLCRACHLEHAGECP